MTPAPLNAAIAAHRFGLGEAQLDTVGADPAAWLRAQIGPGEPAVGTRLATSAQALPAYAEQKVPVSALLEMGGPKANAVAPPMSLRDILNDDQQSRLTTAIGSRRPLSRASSA